ncbi:MAG TPA: MoxR family ATPase [Mycobacteriales bacterium]|nr:MoxR family ATPase [Mycobacteriales bacterium]
MTASPIAAPIAAHEKAQALIAAVEQVVRGRRGTVELTVSAMIAGGHILIEDVPGSGKTTLARAMANAAGGTFRRIQATADLMPSDITGSGIWEPARSAFAFVPGPIFANVVLVDELNRASPRTQSALLEAMDESAVTVDGVRYALPDPFILLATQNPFEQWGTYPLPEGQLDRFMVLVQPGRNPADVERQIVREQLAGPTVDHLTAVLAPGDLTMLREAARAVHVADAVLGYAVALVDATRSHPLVAIGASTRATISLIRCAQARTMLAGRPHLLPDDVKALAVAVLAHRLVLASNDGNPAAAARVITEIVHNTPAPLSGA